MSWRRLEARESNSGSAGNLPPNSAGNSGVLQTSLPRRTDPTHMSPLCAAGIVVESRDNAAYGCDGPLVHNSPKLELLYFARQSLLGRQRRRRRNTQTLRQQLLSVAPVLGDRRPEHIPKFLEEYSREHLLRNLRAPAAEFGHNLATIGRTWAKIWSSFVQIRPTLAKLGPNVAAGARNLLSKCTNSVILGVFV